MPGVRRKMHAGTSAGRDDGFERRRVRSLLPLPAARPSTRGGQMKTIEFNPVCPLPISQYPHVLMAHGGGGKLMHQLIGKMFLTAFQNPLLDTQHDAAVAELTGKKIAFTTDSYVVRPLFFPGGDIGSMAVHGTVNDLAMAGA